MTTPSDSATMPQQATTASSTSPQQQTGAEYMQLYHELQEKARITAQTIETEKKVTTEVKSTTSNAAASSVAAHPSPLDELVAKSHAAANATDDSTKDDDTNSETDADVSGTNSRFDWPGLEYTREDAMKFRLSSWLPLLRKHTIPTRTIELTPEFVEYLCEEGVWIPDAYAPVNASDFKGRDHDEFDAKEDEEKWKEEVGAKVELIESDDDEEDSVDVAIAKRNALRATQPFFPSIITSITSALSALGDSVFPSLDFHTPSDAVWITTEKSARCQSVGEILLLLKSSDKIQQELEVPFEACTSEKDATISDTAASAAPIVSSSSALSSSSTSSSSSSFTPTLSLRKWSTLHRSKLFRAFIYHRQLLCITQYDPNYYAFLQKVDMQEEIQDTIEAWLEDDIQPALDQLQMKNYVLDLYIDTNERVWCVKVKPFYPKVTKSLLFSWKEIYEFAMDAEEKEQEKEKMRQEQRSITSATTAFALASSASTSSSTTTPLVSSGWPTTSDLNVPFRVVASAAAGMDILRMMDSMSTRFPKEGFDVSDSAAIERWIHRVEEGDLKQKK